MKILKYILCVSFLTLSWAVFYANAADLKFQFELDHHSVKSVGDSGLAERVQGTMKLVLEDAVDARFKIEFVNTVAVENPSSLANMSLWATFSQGNIFDIRGADVAKSDTRSTTVLVPFEIKAPDGLVPGEYVGSMNATVVSVDGVPLSSLYAKGITMKFTVPGQVSHSMALTGLHLQGFSPDQVGRVEKSDVALSLTYKPESNVTLRPIAHVRIQIPFGTTYEHDFPLPDVTGHNERTFLIVAPNIRPYVGWMDVQVRLTYSVLNFDGNAGSAVFEAGTSSLRVYLVPWRELLIALGFLVALLAFFLYRRWRSHQMAA